MKFTLRNVAAYAIAKYKILRGGPRKVIEKCKNGDLILSVYTHNMTRTQLKNIIRWLKKNDISFMSVDELNDVFNLHVERPKGKAIITMDDGWRDNNRIMSMAEEMKIPICIFLTIDPIEKGNGFWWSYIKKGKKMGMNLKPVEWYKKLPNEERLKHIDELCRLIKLKREAMMPSMISSKKHSNWVKFGAHTLSHPILPQCDEKRMRDEIRESGDKIKEWTGKPVHYFAYPNGSYGEREINALKENKYHLAFTTTATTISIGENDPYRIPRCEMLESVSLAENICRITGTWIKHR